MPDLADPGALDFMTKNSSIEDIKVGDKVLATDPETGRTVTRLIRTEADKKFNKLTLTTEDGTESLTATHEHPFWSPSEGDWVPASQLTRGMTLRTSNGTHATIKTNHPFTQHAPTTSQSKTSTRTMCWRARRRYSFTILRDAQLGPRALRMASSRSVMASLGVMALRMKQTPGISWKWTAQRSCATKLPFPHQECESASMTARLRSTVSGTE
ncbi:hypothetical protein SLNWT_2375 [Streptomyces albus]|uniref:Hint domain-containing protein n=1 Tax=Streptomyces albus (strain ATCC 21838 / DSM 41398 / FERM P-419 / JCM 4703 / NBRC 107858) TaxID=1081613 RepID=A0A0B5EVN7_STRA4|nr:hypothetical protein SLNWT_2375 [Streptomyces albus]AOU77064.1 hypothetical protein SLNHY_2373 [Streptomyces albus]AYN32841.1 hypothetical protein DUI70_2339 [Streptomyces albus]